MRERERLVCAIYDAAADPTAWAATLADIVAYVGGVMGAMFFYDQETVATPLEELTVHGFSVASVAAYATHYGRYDPRLLWATDHLASGKIYADDRELPFAEVSRSETYQDYYRPLGLGQCLGGSLFREASRQGFLTVHRGVHAGSFRPTQLRRFETLLPHVVRSLQLHRQLASAGPVSTALAFALDHMPTAVVLADEAGRVIHLNGIARDLLSSPKGPLRLVHGSLRPRDDKAAAQLYRALQQANNAACGQDLPPAVLTLGSLAIMIVAIPGGTRAGRPPLLVFIADGTSRLRANAAVLAAQFGLTDAEATVAVLLARGMPPKEVAARRGSSLATVRTQSKMIHEKFAVRTQAELASVVACSVGALRRPS